MAMMLNPPLPSSALVFPDPHLKRRTARGPVFATRIGQGERVPGLSRRQRRQLRRRIQMRRAPMPTRCDPPCKYPEGICCGDGTCVSSVTQCTSFR